MSVTIECHSEGFLTFPTECIRCGKPPKTIMPIDAARRVDVLVAEHETYTEVTVPMCHWCKLQRSFWGFTLGLMIAVGGIGGAMYLLHGAPKATRMWYLTGLLAVFVAVGLYIRNWHTRVMNRLFAGCSAGRLQEDGTYQLWLSRDELAEQVRYQSEPKKYIESASYATQTERAQQQLDTWWGKCVLGLIITGVAVTIFFEITQFENGQKRFLSLPGILMLIYDFLGKWATCLPIGIPGVILFGFGARQFAKEKLLGE